MEFDIPTPRTIVVGNESDVAQVRRKMPDYVIVKDPAGAGSSRVSRKKNSRIFSSRLSLWLLDSTYYRAVCAGLRLLSLKPIRSPQTIVQEEVENEGFDLRVVTIGNKYAYIFKRLVRPNDFRASGSGLIDHVWHEEYADILRRCMSFSRELGFNSMAYDVVVDKHKNWYVVEMSCQYTGKALLSSPNAFVLSEDLEKIEHIKVGDPAELHVRWFLESQESR